MPGGPPGGPLGGTPGPIGAPPGGPAPPTPGGGQEKKAGPSIFFMVIDFLVFGGALTFAILLYLKYS